MYRALLIGGAFCGGYDLEGLAAGARHEEKQRALAYADWDIGTRDREALFASIEGVKWPCGIAPGARHKEKQRALAYADWDIGTRDREALFASIEGEMNLCTGPQCITASGE